MRIVCIVLLIGGLGLLPALAQQDKVSGYTPYGAFQDTLDLGEDQPYELRPFVVKGSEQVFYRGTVLDTNRYRLDHHSGRLSLDTLRGPSDGFLVVVYRTLPFALQEIYSRHQSVTDTVPDTVSSAAQRAPPRREPVSSNSPFEGVDIRRSGSISRAVVAGNRRDVGVESGLRMQLSGNLSEDVQIEAVLSDQNTPIQPDGTTQRLNDLDRVYIDMRTPFGAATLGDFEYTQGEHTFGEFSRKLQGASARTSFSDSRTFPVRGSASAAGAVSRGIYRFQKIEPVEGMQGPYRLTGKHGEPFIIVIAGSERVFLDGEELTRGSSEDYVLDYATGELTFSSNRLIASDSRIAVEFEYTTNRYTRTLLGGEVNSQLWAREDGSPRAEIGTRILREADSRFLGDGRGFGSDDSARVAAAGDGPAIASGAEKVPFDSESRYVQYIRKDTLYEGRQYTIYAPVRARTDSVYRVRFTRIDADSASYRRSGGVVNGVAYEWVGPGNGQYEPVRVLSSPERKQLFDITGSVRPVEGVELFGEWAQSVNDENRLSSLHTADDRGGAYRMGLQIEPTVLEFGGRDLGNVSASVSRRQMGATFQTFARTRSVEFGREWNLPQNVASTGSALSGRQEVETDATVTYRPVSEVSLGVGWGRLDLGSEFEGLRRTFRLRSERAYWPRIDYRLAYVTSRDLDVDQEGIWLQQRGTLRKPLAGGRLIPFVSVAQERRRQHILGQDALASNALGYSEWRPGIEWSQGDLSVQSSIEYRAEERPDGARLRKVADTWTGRTHLDYRPSSNFRTDADLIYRDKTFAPDYEPRRRDAGTRGVVLRWKTQWQSFQRAVQLNSTYEASTRRTPILQETYVRTGAELGEYVWEDANEDDIRQIDEFLPERTPYEGTYAKTFVPSDELVPVIQGHGRVHLRLEPARWWEDSSDLLPQVLREISSQTTFDVREESTTPRLSDVYLLQLSSFRNREHTVNGRLQLAQRLDLFRRQSRYGASLAFDGMRGLNRRAAGYERRFRNRWAFDGRYRVAPEIGTRLELRRERSRSHAQVFGSRSYDIRSWSAAPELSLQVTTGFEATLAVHFSRKQDLGMSDDRQREARILRTPVELKYGRQQRWMLSARIERADVRMQGTARGMAAYELTDGRGPGTSYLWNGTARYSINRFLSASFVYDGRIPDNAPPVHTLRMEVSATF